jgi:osmotically-inducible protein OsmY
MTHQASIQDTAILQKVNERLSSMGIRAPCRVTVANSKGSVTLSGTIQYEHQRHTALHAIRGIAGVQRVVDQMQVIPHGQHWQTKPQEMTHG